MSQAPYRTDPFWDEPDSACTVCRGRGWVLQESGTGAPTHEVECPYCHGRQNASWVAEKREQAHDRWEWRRCYIALAGLALWWAGKWPVWDTSYGLDRHTVNYGLDLLWLLHVLAWIVVVVLWIKSPKMRPTRSTQARKWVQRQTGVGGHAPGFTDQHEKNALGIFGAVVAVKGAWDAHERKLDRIERKIDGKS